MIIVPADTPGRRHRARRPHHGPPRRRGAAARGGHAEIDLPRRARAVGEPRRQPGRRLRARPAAPRPRPHPPRDALARPERPGVRHAVRARRQPLHARLGARREADDPGHGSPTRAAEMQAARLMTLHAAWTMDQVGASERARRDRDDQVLGRAGAARRDRPRHPGARLARLLRRPAARADVPRRARRPHLRRPRRGAQGRPSPAGSCAATSRARCRPSTCPPARRRPGASSPPTWTWRPPTSDRSSCASCASAARSCSRARISSGV